MTVKDVYEGVTQTCCREIERCSLLLDSEAEKPGSAEYTALVESLEKLGNLLSSSVYYAETSPRAGAEQPPVTEEPTKTEAPPRAGSPTEPPIKLPEIRALLGAAGEKGFDVPGLIKSFGVKKLSEIDPADYPKLKAAVENV